MLRLATLLVAGGVLPLHAQGILQATLRGGPAFSVDRTPRWDLWGGEAAVQLRLGSHTRLGVIAGLTRHSRTGRDEEGFYFANTGGFEYVCPGQPCTGVPVRRETRYTDYARFVALTFRVAPGSGTVTRPWVELGLGAYQLGQRFEDRGLPRGGGAPPFDFNLGPDYGWGPGASLGAGGEWFPGGGRVGGSFGVRLHAAVASVRGEVTPAAIATVGIGLAIR